MKRGSSVIFLASAAGVEVGSVVGALEPESQSDPEPLRTLDCRHGL